jgi:hypothetical protein
VTSALWNPFDDPVNKIVLTGKPSPGLADVAGAGTPRKWEERQGYGAGGAILVFLGNGLSQFEVKLRLYTRKDWNDWHAWKSIVQKPPASSRYRPPRALDIYHPLLAECQIKSVVVLDVSQPSPEDELGTWSITIKFQSYRRPKIQLAKPEGSAATPVDPYEQMQLDVIKEINQELAKG